MKEHIVGIPERKEVENPSFIHAIYIRDLVRCRDCKHRGIEQFDHTIKCELTEEEHHFDWFCADGVKRDE